MRKDGIAGSVEMPLHRRAEVGWMVFEIPVEPEVEAKGEFVLVPRDVHLVDVSRRQVPAVRVVLHVAERAGVHGVPILVRKAAVDKQPLVFSQLGLGFEPSAVAPYPRPVVLVVGRLSGGLPLVVGEVAWQFVECVLVVGLETEVCAVVEVLADQRICRVNVVCAASAVSVGLDVVV